MSLYRGAGGASDATDDSTVNAVAGYASSASSSATAAAASATTASSNADAAATSAASAASNVSQAVLSASNASTSASNAANSASSATTSASNAANSATIASVAAGNASSSASDAAASASSASAHATDAANSAAASAASAASAAAVSGSGNGTFVNTPITTNSTITLSNGTAKGVAYLNDNKQLSTGSALIFDGSSLGLGATPNTWLGNRRTLQIGGLAVANVNYGAEIGENTYNTYYDNTGTSFRQTTGPAAIYDFNNTVSGGFAWRLAGSASAGTTPSFTQAMTLDASGRLGIGTTTPDQRLVVNGSIALTYNNGSTSGSGLSMSGVTQNYFNVLTGTGSNIIHQFTGSGGAAKFSIYENGNALVAGSLLVNTGGSVGADSIGEYTGGSTPLTIGTTGPRDLIFRTNNTERARINSAGALLVGSTATVDSAKFYVAGGGISHDSNQFNCRPGTGINYEWINRNGAGFDFYVNNASNLAARIDSSGNLIQSTPATPPTLTTNGQMVFNLTSNTNLRVSVRGSDGVTRTANITLA